MFSSKSRRTICCAHTAKVDLLVDVISFQQLRAMINGLWSLKFIDLFVHALRPSQLLSRHRDYGPTHVSLDCEVIFRPFVAEADTLSVNRQQRPGFESNIGQSFVLTKLVGFIQTFDVRK